MSSICGSARFPLGYRGLPSVQDGRSVYVRPDWLPVDGNGILFLDELTNAAPTVQGLAQQLLLDRRVGEHRLGDGWFIVAAGNAREHGASTHGMPTPVANRMYHFELEAELNSWKSFAITHDVHEDVVAFVSFRPELLFRLDKKAVAFPTPRSWEGASRLHTLGMSVAPAVGESVAQVSGLLRCGRGATGSGFGLSGHGDQVDFPDEVSARYATCIGLAIRVADEHEALHAFNWLIAHAGPEWIQMFISDAFLSLQKAGRSGRICCDDASRAVARPVHRKRPSRCSTHEQDPAEDDCERLHSLG